jgi:hypothetical protein
VLHSVRRHPHNDAVGSKELGEAGSSDYDSSTCRTYSGNSGWLPAYSGLLAALPLRLPALLPQPLRYRILCLFLLACGVEPTLLCVTPTQNPGHQTPWRATADANLLIRLSFHFFFLSVSLSPPRPHPLFQTQPRPRTLGQHPAHCRT